MSDDPGLEMLKAGAEGTASGLVTPVVNAARAMFAAVLGDTADAFDDYLTVRLNDRAMLRKVTALARAKEMCEQAGIDPGSVGIKIVQPILEGAALEDDDDLEMAEKWAALLANASAGDAAAATVLPSFPQILSELTPPQAVILDWLNRGEKRRSKSLVGLRMELGYGKHDTGSTHDVELAVYLDNLQRLGLCDVELPNPDVDSLAQRIDRHLQTRKQTDVRVTILGRAFVGACTPPTGAQRG